MQDIEIIGVDGRRRRAKPGEVLQDGETFSMRMQFLDAAGREVADHLAAKYGTRKIVDAAGNAAGSRPGFCFGNTSSNVADAAYEQMKMRLDAKTRRHDPDDEEEEEGETTKRSGLAPPGETESAWLRKQATARKAAAETMGGNDAATVAYEERSARMRTAWRDNRDA